MSLFETKKKLEKYDIIGFVLFIPVMTMVLGGLAGKIGAPFKWSVWALGALATVTFVTVPGWRLPIYKGWMRLVSPIGWVFSMAIMAVLFYGVFTPLGLLLRMLGRDPLERKIEPRLASYWVDRKQQASPLDRYFRQS